MDSKHPAKDVEAGFEALPTYTPPQHEAQPNSNTRSLKKLALLAAAGTLLFLTVGKGVGFGGRGLLGMNRPEWREGWEMVQHQGGRNRWEGPGRDEVGGEDKWKEVESFTSESSYLSLGRSPLDFDNSNTAFVYIPDDARTLVVHANEGAQARVVFEASTAGETEPQVFVQMEADGSSASVEELDGEEDGIVGVVLSSHNKESYIITVTLPAASSKPISFIANGNLIFEDLDLDSHQFKDFSLSSSSVSDLRINNLNARSGNVQLASGAISGSFNVSGELVLITTNGDIDANVTVHESHHGKGKGPKRPRDEKHFEARDEHKRPFPRPPKGDQPHPPPKGEHPPPPPHGEHPPPHPHGPPPARVFTKTQIGSINLFYSGEISNHTALLSKSVTDIGSVNVGVLSGFKGMFAEGSKIGEVSYTVDASNPVHVIKEVHTGPGSFIKGLVGPPPSHHGKPNGTHHHGPNDDHKKHDKREFEDDEDKTLDELVESGKQSPPKHPKGPKGPGGPPFPPPGLPPHDMPPPPKGGHRDPPPPPPPPAPPGYGFIGAFTSTGKVSLVFL